MPRNGSGTMTPDVDFTTEAASPPIEIAKLDQVLDDIADELTNSIAADGQTNPSAALKMNGFNHTNVGAATALTHYVRLSEMIDQDHVFYVDSGSANTYVITPSPAIAAYEEGQRFVFRATNANSGASTLNVNGLGAIAIQTPDGQALASGAIVSGGYYEVVYDANATPDRWVLMSMPSDIPDGLLSSNVALYNANMSSFSSGTLADARLSSNVPLKNAANVFTVAQVVQVDGAAFSLKGAGSGSANQAYMQFLDGDNALVGYVGDESGSDAAIGLSAAAGPLKFYASNTLSLTVETTGITTPNTVAGEVGYKGTPQNAQNGNYTLVLTDAGKTIYKASGGAGETITIPANASVAFPVGTIVRVVNNGGGTLSIAITSDTLSLAGAGTTGTRTLSDHGVAVLEKVASTEWFISGAGVS